MNELTGFRLTEEYQVKPKVNVRYSRRVLDYSDTRSIRTTIGDTYWYMFIKKEVPLWLDYGINRLENESETRDNVNCFKQFMRLRLTYISLQLRIDLQASASYSVSMERAS